MNNNRMNTTENCLKYFSRNQFLKDFRRPKRSFKEWTEESKQNRSQKIKEKIVSKENFIIKPQLKKGK
jgi:hypothetical protein